MTRILLFAFLTFLQVGLAAQPVTGSDEKAIRHLMNDQISAWNKGDIDEFMKGYWNSGKYELTPFQLQKDQFLAGAANTKTSAIRRGKSRWAGGAESCRCIPQAFVQSEYGLRCLAFY